MSSAILLNAGRTPPPAPKTASTEFFSSLEQPMCCVIQLRQEREGVVHQVVLDPGKMKRTTHSNIIRLGEWCGDEAAGWKYLPDISIVVVLGHATRDSDSLAATVKVTPLG